jgi:hypothetical protein
VNFIFLLLVFSRLIIVSVIVASSIGSESFVSRIISVFYTFSHEETFNIH